MNYSVRKSNNLRRNISHCLLCCLQVKKSQWVSTLSGFFQTFLESIQLFHHFRGQVLAKLIFVVLSQVIAFFQPVVFWDAQQLLHVYFTQAFNVDGFRFRNVPNWLDICHVLAVATLQDPIQNTAILSESCPNQIDI